MKSTAIATLLALILTGCSAFMHGYAMQDVVRKTLPAGHGEGLDRLHLEQAVDPTIRAYVDANGAPDYIYVHSRFSVSLLYVTTGSAVTFSRSTWNSRSGAPITTAIPLKHILDLSPDDQARLVAEPGDEARDLPQAQTSWRSATCFAVSPDGLVATSLHAVAGATAIAVKLQSGGIFEATIGSSSGANDLALLRIPAKTPHYLPLAGVRSARTGDPVFTLGYPTPSLLGAEARYTEGAVSALSGISGDASLLQITVPIQPGNSGGPLVNERGEVVGIVTSQAAAGGFLSETGSLPQNLNFAVKADVLGALFDAPARAPAPAMGRRETIERVRQALCLVVAE